METRWMSTVTERNSSDSEMDIDDEIENDRTFLRTTRSGRSIPINWSLF